MKAGGLITLIGFLMIYGGVGGMENPDQADYFLEQLVIIAVGMAVMFAGVLMINSNHR